MPRTYLEIEPQIEQSVSDVFPIQYVRVDVTGLSEQDIVKKARELLQILGWKNVKVYIHYCYHDVGQPCRRVDITDKVLSSE